MADTPSPKVRYLVLKNPRFEMQVEAEAHNARGAIKKAAGDEQGTYFAVPLRNVTVVEVGEAPPAPPQMSMMEQDTAEWLRQATGIIDAAAGLPGTEPVMPS